MHKKMTALLLSLGVSSSFLGADWQPLPTQLSPSVPNGAQRPSVAYSNAGNALAVSYISSSFIGYTYNGTSWEPGVTLSPAVGSTSSVAVDPTGNGLAVYTGPSGVQASRYQFSNDTWFDIGGSSVLLQASAFEPSVTMSAQGNGLAIYRNGALVFASQYSGTTQTWSDTQGSAIPLSSIGGSIQSTAIAMDANSNGLAIWADATTNTIQAANYSGTTNTWSNTQGSAITLSLNNISGGSNGDVAMSSNGTGLAVWVANPGSGNVVQSAWYNGSSWQFTGASALTVSATGALGATPAVAMDENGNGIAAWRQGITLVQAAYFNGSTQTWGAPVNLSLSGNSFGTPSVAFADDGNAFVAWIHFDGTETLAQSANYNSSLGTWENTGAQAITISDPTESVSSVVIAANSHGRAVAAFPQGAYPNSALFVNLFAPPLPDNGSNFIGRAGNDKFLSQIDHVHFLSWTASTTPDVVGYLIRVDGIVIANVLATEPLVLVLNNQRPGVPITYTLTSYNALGDESSPSTVTIK